MKVEVPMFPFVFTKVEAAPAPETIPGSLMKVALSALDELNTVGEIETVIGNVAMPLALRSAWDILSNGLVISGFALYALGAVVWRVVLAQWDVSKAYPLVGLGFVFTLVVGLMQGEQIGVARAAGVLLIVLGVFLVSRS